VALYPQPRGSLGYLPAINGDLWMSVRNTTKRKYFGKINAISYLRSAANKLEEAKTLSTQPVDSPFTKKLEEVIKELQFVLEAIKIYNMGLKRLTKRVEKEKCNIQALLDEVKSFLVFPEEKLLAKEARRREKNNEHKTEGTEATNSGRSKPGALSPAGHR
jgi:hypothetical protein